MRDGMAATKTALQYKYLLHYDASICATWNRSWAVQWPTVTNREQSNPSLPEDFVSGEPFWDNKDYYKHQ